MKIGEDLGLKVLLVEDDEVDRMAFERFVTREGLPYECQFATSVADARAALAARDFDVILLDFNLPDGTGFDVIELKPAAPIILITGTNQTDTAVSAMKAGAYDYVIKDHERNYLRVLPVAIESAMKRKEAEETFTILSHALMSAADSIFITDLDGRITFLNSAVADTYGYAEADLLGRDIAVIGETRSEGEYYHRRKDGTEFPVSLSRSEVNDETGREIAMVVLARDITDRKQAEEELRRINAELEGYAHTVSHDLKGPLASTTLATSTLERLLSEKGLAIEGSDIKNLLGILDNNVWKSAALIDDLLALAEAGQMPESVEDVDVLGVVRRVASENEGAIEERSITLEMDGDLGTVRAAPAHVYQLFSNLIGNCIKHCGADVPVIRIERVDDDGAGCHTYLISDNGVGIPEADLTRIFAPFFKGATGGTGIGLATVKKITNLYGGSVQAYNDGGACFQFTLNDQA
ncbi:MAG TPA: ATP-binding protein [Candidatus Anoxymicrobiaceae bacterium]